MNVRDHSCQICAAEALTLVADYANLPRATSDSRPWRSGGRLTVCEECGTIQKIPDAQWLQDILEIYAAYDIYHQSAGSEQLIFDPTGSAEPRSKRLIDLVARAANLPARGTLIDIGCGNGAWLRNCSQALPGWKLFGCELSDKALATLERIPNFEKLFVGATDDIRERFSLVSMIHTLEHLRSPADELINAAALLKPQGVFFIEVPDIENSPFDLLVADHLVHFSRATLGFLAARCGIQTMLLQNTFVHKEITLLGRLAIRANPALPDAAPGIHLARRTVQWLNDTFTAFRAVAEAGPIGIFGTAIAGMAAYSAFKGKTQFFVDEDPRRIGRQYDGKLVLSPAQAPKDTPVLLALPPQQAGPLAERCRSVGLTCICPPPLRREDEQLFENVSPGF
jgi:SAM-dependent methyltransferase